MDSGEMGILPDQVEEQAARRLPGVPVEQRVVIRKGMGRSLKVNGRPLLESFPYHGKIWETTSTAVKTPYPFFPAHQRMDSHTEILKDVDVANRFFFSFLDRNSSFFD
ncbi:hypothetical protein B2K_39745 [Paenibacillus mucilaginosus K02]|uniref:Uncharacterized protein n=1 Tax=Paenibacillus mucilaginosus K02 TaxID=997761 RepID=R9ULL3_9BACL|nr:hypothetical protein B2K_39745 [Paenibacillus mucilaginosus K02]